MMSPLSVNQSQLVSHRRLLDLPRKCSWQEDSVGNVPYIRMSAVQYNKCFHSVSWITYNLEFKKDGYLRSATKTYRKLMLFYRLVVFVRAFVCLHILIKLLVRSLVNCSFSCCHIVYVWYLPINYFSFVTHCIGAYMRLRNPVTI